MVFSPTNFSPQNAFDPFGRVYRGLVGEGGEVLLPGHLRVSGFET